jgi:hypothetical protein
MRAELKRLHSPDIENLRDYLPKDQHNFGFLLQLIAGPLSEPGEESFDVFVCTPEWIELHHPPTEIVIGRHILIVFEYDFDRLFRFLQEYFSRCSGSTWQEIAVKLSRLGKWEFEDYTEAEKIPR